VLYLFPSAICVIAGRKASTESGLGWSMLSFFMLWARASGWSEN